jgi:hypothetical protein
MNIRVDLTSPITDGTEVVFRSPVDCSQITGLIVYYGEDSKEFVLADAHGNNVGDIDHLFAENVVVKVILDVTHAMAYVQNADTNAYIESTFVKSVNGVKPDKNGNVDDRPYIVTIEKNEDGTYTADTTADELAVQSAVKVIMCDYEGYLLPLKMVVDGEYYFSGIIDTTSIHVVVRPNGSIGIQKRDLAQESEIPKNTLCYTPQDLTPEQKAQARKNINSNQSFMLEFTVEEAGVTSVIIPLPADLYKTVIFNIHGTYPNAETEFEIRGDFGGKLVGMGKIPAGETPGSNFFGLKQMGIYHMTHSAVSAISNVAKFGAANATTAIPEGTTNVKISCHTENTTFPVGTTFEIWGVYDE